MKRLKNNSIYKLLRICFFLLLSISLFSCSEKKKEVNVFTTDWKTIESSARSKKVYFNAWGGSPQVNQYIQWVKEQVKERYAISLIHVPLQDGLEAVRRIQQEKVAGNDTKGSVDLLWLNGNAFHVLKENELFLGKILPLLPNRIYLDKNNPVLFEDFTVATEGLEVPWGTAQLNFFSRTDKVEPFYNLVEMEQQLRRYPGSFTYPSPFQDFTGRTFLKNLIYLHATDSSIFYTAYKGTEAQKAALERNAAWNFLDRLHPFLWRSGESFPGSYVDMLTRFKDSEIHYGMSFNPYDALSRVLNGEFPHTVRPFLLEEGTVANAHFLTVPYNTRVPAAALVVINFLISPEAQSRKANPEHWGDPTVLDRETLNNQQKEFFTSEASRHPSAPPEELGKRSVREFHGTWEEPIQDFWKERYLLRSQ